MSKPYDKEKYIQDKERIKLYRLRNRLLTHGTFKLNKLPLEMFIEYFGGTKEQVVSHFNEITKIKNFPSKAYNNTILYKIVSIIDDSNIPRSIRHHYKNLTIIKT